MTRRPLALPRWVTAGTASGPFHGVQPVNVNPAVYTACVDHRGNVDPVMFEALHTRISYAGLLDILEMRDVHRSHETAAVRNSEHARELSKVGGGR